MSVLIIFGVTIPTFLLLFLGFGAGVAAIAEWGVIGLLILAVLLPLAFVPAIFVQSRLIWSVPLVLDARLPVMEAFSASWRLTGKVLKGFGMFAILGILALVGMIGAAMILGICLAIFAGGVGVAAGGMAAQQAGTTQESPQFDTEQRLGESFEEYMNRLDREGEQRMRDMERRIQAQAGAAVVGMSTIVMAVVVSIVLCVVLLALLGPVLAMPIFVGYRNMSQLVGQAGW